MTLTKQYTFSSNSTFLTYNSSTIDIINNQIQLKLLTAETFCFKYGNSNETVITSSSLEIIIADSNVSVNQKNISSTGGTEYIEGYILYDPVTLPVGVFYNLNYIYAADPGSSTEIKYVISIDGSTNFYYWNNIWTISNGINESNDIDTFNSNCTSLDIYGKTYLLIKSYFPSNDTSLFSYGIGIFYTADSGYSTNSSYILLNSSIRTDLLYTFSEISTKTTNNEIKYIIQKNNVDYWYSTVSTSWTLSNSSYSQSNLSSQVNSNCTSLTSSGIDLNIKLFLHSETSTSTPKLTSLTLTYDYAGIEPIMNNHVYSGYLKNIDNSAVSSKQIKLNYDYQIGTNAVITNTQIATTTRDDGYWEIEFYYESRKPDRLYWDLNGKRYVTNFTTGTFNFSDLTILQG